jgi:hypothetical protein
VAGTEHGDEGMNGLQVARPWWLLPPGHIHPLWWIVLGAVLLWADRLTGAAAQFPVLYALPVILAAWFSGRWPALSLAIAVPLVRIATLVMPQSRPDDIAELVLLTMFRGVVVVFLAVWFARLAALERDLELKVKVLEGLLPICSFCKSIRNEAGEWEHLETFISRRSDAEFSHSLCPSCGTRHYPGIMDDDPQPSGKAP